MVKFWRMWSTPLMQLLPVPMWPGILVTIKVEPDIGLIVSVFVNAPGNLGLIPGRVILKTQKNGTDATLLNTQHYKIRIKGKVEQSREISSALPYTLV